MEDSKVAGCWGFLILLMAMAMIGCGNPRSPEHQPSRTAAPQAASGQSMVYGAILVVPGHCQGSTLANMLIQNLSGNLIFSSQFPGNSAYQTQLTPGDYVLTATASTCVFARSFRVASDESLPIDVILQ